MAHRRWRTSRAVTIVIPDRIKRRGLFPDIRKLQNAPAKAVEASYVPARQSQGGGVQFVHRCRLWPTSGSNAGVSFGSVTGIG